MTAGRSTCTNACWWPATASRSGTAAARTPTAPSAPPISPHDNIVGYPDHYVQSTERHPMDLLSHDHRRARLGPRHDRRRDGQLLFLGRRLRVAAAPSAERPLRGRDRRSSTGSGRSRARPSSTTCARPAASSRRCTSASSRRSSPACANAISWPRSTTPARAASTAIGGDYAGDRAAAALGRRMPRRRI